MKRNDLLTYCGISSLFDSSKSMLVLFKKLLLIRTFLVITFMFLLLISAGSFSYAAEVSLNASVTPEKGTVGQPLSYSLTIFGVDPGSVKITLPEKKVVYPEKKNENKNEKKNPGEVKNLPGNLYRFI